MLTSQLSPKRGGIAPSFSHLGKISTYFGLKPQLLVFVMDYAFDIDR